MGWGAKRVAAPAPQPALPELDYEGPELSEKAAATLRKRYAPKNLETTEWLGDPPEPPSDAAKAEIAYFKMKSRKGWTDPTLIILLHEFLKSRGLFADLNKFLGRR
jgi:hypothetical protein